MQVSCQKAMLESIPIVAADVTLASKKACVDPIVCVPSLCQDAKTWLDACSTGAAASETVALAASVRRKYPDSSTTFRHPTHPNFPWLLQWWSRRVGCPSRRCLQDLARFHEEREETRRVHSHHGRQILCTYLSSEWLGADQLYCAAPCSQTAGTICACEGHQKPYAWRFHRSSRQRYHFQGGFIFVSENDWILINKKLHF